MRNGHLGFGVMAAVLAIVSCTPDDGKQPVHTPSSTSAGGATGDLYSNILRKDYVGPKKCGECHKENYSTWKMHPHSRMNQLVGDEAVLGDFSGASLSYGDGKVVFRKQEDLFVMEYFHRDKMVRRFKVTRTIGWRYLQEYVGIQTLGPEPPADPLYTAETRLEFGYVLKEKRWVPQSYLDAPFTGSEYKADGSFRYDPFEPERTPFNTRCIHCHNTYAYDHRLSIGETLTGFPSPPAHALRALFGEKQAHHSRSDVPFLPSKELVTVGISCESCHFGGREHSVDGRKEIRFVPTHPHLAGWTPDHVNARNNPAIVNSICRQCHHSGAGSWPDGSALLNSMESLEQDRGACRSKLSCTDCHNPHVRGPDAGAPDRREHVAACIGCHGNLKTPEAAAAHSHHDPKQVSCLECHMPRIVHGFDAFNRTHRISSPTEPIILTSGMPNACNLCHLDRSLAWTRDTLSEWWGKKITFPRFLERFFGKDHASPAGESWLDHPNGMMRVVVEGAYARSNLGKSMLPRLLKSLDDPNAYLRIRSLQTVERVLGRKLSEEEYSLTGPPKKRREQVQRLIEGISGK